MMVLLMVELFHHRSVVSEIGGLHGHEATVTDGAAEVAKRPSQVQQVHSSAETIPPKDLAIDSPPLDSVQEVQAAQASEANLPTTVTTEGSREVKAQVVAGSGGTRSDYPFKTSEDGIVASRVSLPAWEMLPEIKQTKHFIGPICETVPKCSKHRTRGRDTPHPIFPETLANITAFVRNLPTVKAGKVVKDRRMPFYPFLGLSRIRETHADPIAIATILSKAKGSVVHRRAAVPPPPPPLRGVEDDDVAETGGGAVRAPNIGPDGESLIIDGKEDNPDSLMRKLEHRFNTSLRKYINKPFYDEVYPEFFDANLWCNGFPDAVKFFIRDRKLLNPPTQLRGVQNTPDELADLETPRGVGGERKMPVGGGWEPPAVNSELGGAKGAGAEQGAPLPEADNSKPYHVRFAHLVDNPVFQRYNRSFWEDDVPLLTSYAQKKIAYRQRLPDGQTCNTTKIFIAETTSAFGLGGGLLMAARSLGHAMLLKRRLVFYPEWGRWTGRQVRTCNARGWECYFLPPSPCSYDRDLAWNKDWGSNLIKVRARQNIRTPDIARRRIVMRRANRSPDMGFNFMPNLLPPEVTNEMVEAITGENYDVWVQRQLVRYLIRGLQPWAEVMVTNQMESSGFPWLGDGSTIAGLKAAIQRASSIDEEERIVHEAVAKSDYVIASHFRNGEALKDKEMAPKLQCDQVDLGLQLYLIETMHNQIAPSVRQDGKRSKLTFYFSYDEPSILKDAREFWRENPKLSGVIHTAGFPVFKFRGSEGDSRVKMRKLFGKEHVMKVSLVNLFLAGAGDSWTNNGLSNWAVMVDIVGTSLGGGRHRAPYVDMMTLAEERIDLIRKWCNIRGLPFFDEYPDVDDEGNIVPPLEVIFGEDEDDTPFRSATAAPSARSVPDSFTAHAGKSRSGDMLDDNKRRLAQTVVWKWREDHDDD